MSFKPVVSISKKLPPLLKKIDAAKEKMTELPVVPNLLKQLRESARLSSIHYSTQIEGNRLTMEEVRDVLYEQKTFLGRMRDEKEVKAYAVALGEMEKIVAKGEKVTEKIVQKLHSLLMAGGKKRVMPTAYRDGQNVIREGATGAIVYLPPEAKDVPGLMADLVAWINSSDLPVPIISGIAHYQLVTIHPYYDGNGRLARLLATMILHLHGYGLKGIFSLDEYYASDLPAYYKALTVGPSHNYYLGREEDDIIGWVEYFCEGAAQAFERVVAYAAQEARKKN